MIEKLRIGAPVYTRDGKRAGALERIVVAPAESTGGERHVTSLVVDPGFRDLGELLSPGAVEKSRARTVPIEQAVSIEQDGIHLNCDAKAFEALPLFERREYLAAPEAPSSGRRFRWGDIINYAAAAFGLGAAPYLPESEATTFDEAAGSAALPARAPVWRDDPHEQIGQIEQTLVDSETDHVTGFVLRRARSDEELVVLPVAAITSIEDGLAHVTLSDTELDNLEPYEE